MTTTSPRQILAPPPPPIHIDINDDNEPNHSTFTTQPSIPFRRPAAFSVTSPSLASISTWTSIPRPPSRKRFRTRSASQPAPPAPAPQPPPTKSVQFDLRPRYDTPPSTHRRARTPTGDLRSGYETDDSDSTIDGLDRSRAHRHDWIPERARQHPHRAIDLSDTENFEMASDSTIELPDRFDSHGRRLLEYRL
ncbi:hypothetical protein EMPG_15078, partial [Blastomyces silverae]